MNEQIDYHKSMPWAPRGWGPKVVAVEDRDRLREGLASAGFLVLFLDGRIESEPGFHEAIAKVLAFPDYYGKNWDAFDECIRDWAMLDDKPAALVWSRWDDWLRTDVPGFVRTVAMLADVGRLDRQLEVFMVGPIRLDRTVKGH
jgi:RNAse (barnase) inhibitor barstar